MARKFVICINRGEYLASLEPHKLYQVKPDAKAKAHDLLRVVDESGEDYLYPAKFFVPVDLPDNLKRKLATPIKSAHGFRSQTPSA